MKNSNLFVTLTVEEAKNVFRESLAELVDVIKVPAKQTSNPVKDKMSMAEALQFFKDNNYPISKSTLYQKASQKEIPYHKINNKRLVFYRSELEEWIRQRTTSVNDSIDNAVLLLAESVNRKKQGGPDMYKVEEKPPKIWAVQNSTIIQQ